MTTIIPWGIAYYEEVAATRIDVGGRCFRGVQKQSNELQQRFRLVARQRSTALPWRLLPRRLLGRQCTVVVVAVAVVVVVVVAAAAAATCCWVCGCFWSVLFPVHGLRASHGASFMSPSSHVARVSFFPPSHERSVQLVLNCKASLHLSPSDRRDKAFRVRLACPSTAGYKRLACHPTGRLQGACWPAADRRPLLAR